MESISFNEAQNGQASVAGNSEDLKSSLNPAFGLTDKISIFSYLVISERVGWYRAIMRFFTKQHHQFYRYQLTSQEIWDEVRQQFDPEYSIEKCQADLRSLEEWGNLITTHDTNRHTSIASFRSPALLYQATPLAIAVEGFLDEQRRLGSMSGALRQGDLARLWQMLQQLDKLIAQPDTRLIAEEWRSLFELFNTMAREAAQYLANMTANARLPRPSLEAYQSYKRSVIEYVTNFGQALTYYGQFFRNQLKAWFDNGRHEILIEAVADHLQPPGTELEKSLPRPTLVREAANQLNALVHWFSAGSSADSFRRAAATEVEKVVRRAEQLAATTRPNTNYAADLDKLARRLLEAVQPEESNQLLLVAFAHGLPGHLPESLARPSGTSGTRPDWQEAPSVTPSLREIGRALRIDRTPELPTNSNRAAELVLIEQRRLQRQAELAQFAALFETGILDLAEVFLNSITERNALLGAVQNCLRDSQHQYYAPDGSIIRLLNPAEQNYGVLKSSDGGVLMPRYRLVREEKVR